MISLKESILKSTNSGITATPIKFSKLYRKNKIEKAKKDFLDFYKDYPGLNPKEISYAFSLFDIMTFVGYDFQVAFDKFTYEKLETLGLEYCKKQENAPILFKEHVTDLPEGNTFEYYCYDYKEKEFFMLTAELEKRTDILGKK
jgi:hypothetical protein